MLSQIRLPHNARSREIAHLSTTKSLHTWCTFLVCKSSSVVNADGKVEAIGYRFIDKRHFYT